jgi:hypothetical protein
MILISHRGNINGIKSDLENKSEYINEALNQGFDVEIDVWWIDNQFYLGHDEPRYLVKEDFLKKDGLWCHAKNIDALNRMIDNGRTHCFWHQEDDVTLTSEGYLWTYPGKQLTSNSIAVLPEGNVPDDIAGICSDYVAHLARGKNK